MIRLTLGILTPLLVLPGCLFPEYQEEFDQLNEPPEILSVTPSVLRVPITEPIVFKFTSTAHADDYEIFLNGTQVLAEPTDGLVVNQRMPGDTELSYVVYPPGHPAYRGENEFLENLPASREPYNWFVRAVSEFQYVPSAGLGSLIVCNLPPPTLTGFADRCPQMPCGNNAMFELRPLTWTSVPGATAYQFEAYQVSSSAPVSEAQRRFFESISREQPKLGEPPEGPMVGYGLVTNNSHQIPFDSENCPAQTPLFPGFYVYRVRATNEYCTGSWSDFQLFSYATRWENPDAGDAISIMNDPVGGGWAGIEGIASNWLGTMMTVNVNGGAQNIFGPFLFEGPGGGSTPAPKDYLDNSQILIDPFGSNVDGVTIDDEGNIYVASDQTGYVYRYRCVNPQFDPGTGFVARCESHTLDLKIGRGVSSPHNPCEDTLFWGVTYHAGRLYTTDANRYNTLNGHPECGIDFSPPRQVCAWDAETGEQLYCFDGPRVQSSNPLGNDMFGITVDRCRNLIMVSDNDAFAADTVVYDLNGTELERVITEDLNKPQQPAGNAIGCDGRLYVMDGEKEENDSPTRRIHVFRPTEDGFVRQSWCNQDVLVGSPRTFAPTDILNTLFARGLSIDMHNNLYLARGHDGTNFNSVGHIYKPLPVYP